MGEPDLWWKICWFFNPRRKWQQVRCIFGQHIPIEQISCEDHLEHYYCACCDKDMGLTKEGDA